VSAAAAAPPAAFRRLLREVGRLARREEARGLAARVRALAAALAAEGWGALELGPLTARLEAALVRRLAGLFEAERGPAPAPWAWLALGAGARREQPLPGDQDHALVLGDGLPARAQGWHRALARQVAEDLAAAGYPPCAGGLGAGGWCLPQAGWCEQVRGAAAAPGPEEALQVAVLLDGRRIAGRLPLGPLRAALLGVGRHPRLLRELARGALAFRPAGPLRAALLRRPVDLKREGLAPLALSARCLGAAAGSAERSTCGRLAAARDAGLLGADLAAEAAEAFRLLSDLRLRSLLLGPPPRALLDPGGLPPAERRALGRALRAANRLQDRTADRLGLG
jgi:CBS domain-containing protein